MTYTLDANILINLSNVYPREIFGSLWASIESLAEEGHACICEMVLSELARGGDSLHDWAKDVPNFVCSTSEPEMLTVAQISQAHPEWVRGQKNQGDPFVIAHAKQEQRLLVTEERRRNPQTAERNQTIPHFADEHGVECIRFLDFVRSEGWTF